MSTKQLPPEYQDAALAYAANVLRTMSASYDSQPGELSYELALRWAARKLDGMREES